MDRNAQINQSFSGQSSCSMASSACSQNVGSNERILSAVAGGLCLGHSLWGRVFPRPMALMLGAGLIYRAVTGHCSVYQSLGMSTCDEENQGSSALAMQHSSPSLRSTPANVALAATGEIGPGGKTSDQSPTSGTHH